MIPNRWYPVLESSKLRRKPVGVTRMGRKLALWRDASGQAIALPAACPHRGAALANGRVVAGELECPWHGFRFRADGACAQMPCEGEAARPPAALGLAPFPTAEAHGLVWLWWGDARAERPAVPFFEEFAGRDLRATAEASYELPYHYSRMVETNLDIHHTPFVHKTSVPGVGARVDPFEARLDGDRIRTSGVLRHERKRKEGFAFRADCLLPCLGAVSLGESLHIVISATPVDENRTWLWFRYYQDLTSIAPLGKLITFASVQAELLVVQRQDWRIFAGLPGGTIDDADLHLVRADKGIALYRRRRRELLDEPRLASADVAVGAG